MGNRELKVADKRCQIYRKNVYPHGFQSRFILNYADCYLPEIYFGGLNFPWLFPLPDSWFVYRYFWFKGDINK